MAKSVRASGAKVTSTFTVQVAPAVTAPTVLPLAQASKSEVASGRRSQPAGLTQRCTSALTL